MTYLYSFLICGAAVAFYSIVVAAPWKTVPVSAVTAALFYTVYRLISEIGGQDILGYFVASLLVAVSGEICARIYKMPSTIFVFPGILPLVPGYWLYRTMLYLVQNDYDGFAHTGVQTLFISGAIAISIAVTNVAARHIFPRRDLKTPKKRKRGALQPDGGNK